MVNDIIGYFLTVNVYYKTFFHKNVIHSYAPPRELKSFEIRILFDNVESEKFFELTFTFTGTVMALKEIKRNLVPVASKIKF